MVESSAPHIQHFGGFYEKGELESTPVPPKQRVELGLKFTVQHTNPFFFFLQNNQHWHIGSY